MLEQIGHQRPFGIREAATVGASFAVLAPVGGRVPVALRVSPGLALGKLLDRLDAHDTRRSQCAAHGQAADFDAAALLQQGGQRLKGLGGVLGHHLAQGKDVLLTQSPWPASTVDLGIGSTTADLAHGTPPCARAIFRGSKRSVDFVYTL
jgi:hypothetical protein